MNEETINTQEETKITSEQTQWYVVDTPNKALNIMVQGLETGLKNGLYSFQESKLIYDSITFFFPNASVEHFYEEQAKQIMEQQLKSQEVANNKEK